MKKRSLALAAPFLPTTSERDHPGTPLWPLDAELLNEARLFAELARREWSLPILLALDAAHLGVAPSLAECVEGLRWTELLHLSSGHVPEPPVANVFNRALEALVEAQLVWKNPLPNERKGGLYSLSPQGAKWCLFLRAGLELLTSVSVDRDRIVRDDEED